MKLSKNPIRSGLEFLALLSGIFGRKSVFASFKLVFYFKTFGDVLCETIQGSKGIRQ